jgi:3alpha(or 20beta)-hydroxysteroid dehydrogenase
VRGLKGKVVIVTGAARGIGRATATAFAEAGSIVIATDVLLDEVAALASELRAGGGRVDAIRQDVTSAAEWHALFESVAGKHGRVDILINNAGIARIGTIESASIEDWRRTFDVNVESVFLGTQAAIAAMKSRGGVIVNVASIAGRVAEQRLAAYNASKGAVRLLTMNAAMHCARMKYPIRINSIDPGYTETPLVANALATMPSNEAETYAADIVAQIPMGRLAKPSEIAEPILFLASDSASYMTGTGLVVDGGYTAV